jgi:hypothetical protein
VHTTEIATSLRIGFGPRRLGFNYGSVVIGEAIEDAPKNRPSRAGNRFSDNGDAMNAGGPQLMTASFILGFVPALGEAVSTVEWKKICLRRSATVEKMAGLHLLVIFPNQQLLDHKTDGEGVVNIFHRGSTQNNPWYNPRQRVIRTGPRSMMFGSEVTYHNLARSIESV